MNSEKFWIFVWCSISLFPLLVLGIAWRQWWMVGIGAIPVIVIFSGIIYTISRIITTLSDISRGTGRDSTDIFLDATGYYEYYDRLLQSGE
jgi:hypothetical protein